MTPRTLEQLFQDQPDIRLPDSARRMHVRRVRDDSRQVEQGDVFVAVRGAAADGTGHITEAVERGAAAIVIEAGGEDPPALEALAGAGVPIVRVPNARNALAELAAAFFDYPARRVRMVGITGTVGKTSVLAMLAEILAAAAIRAGTMGSLGIRFPGGGADSPNTTPGALTVQESLSDMAAAGVSVAAMEVTSHALVQERIRGLRYDLGVFTNLTMLEHLEYHGSFRNYAAAKLRFLDTLAPKAPLCYAAGDRVVRQAARQHPGPRISCGGGGAWVLVRREPLSLSGTRISLTIRRPLPRLDGSCLEPCTVPVQLQTLGRPNTANATLAAAAGLIAGAPPEAVREGLARIAPPKRRLEVIYDRGPIVIDDTVGHPDSITGVFEVAESVQHRELRVVFCIRGRRGPDINARDAEAVAIWSRRVHIHRLHVTSAEDTADDRNTVSRDERRAFLDTLEGNAVEHEHHPRLEDAITAALSGSADEDVVLLLGAQGMDAGAAIARAMLDDAGSPLDAAGEGRTTR
ncbi:MAG TPA: Mur ligase family protein [Longimicrobiales bacterium]|nr:Mur ligase family protein [Longimicrobiales bacterium]